MFRGWTILIFLVGIACVFLFTRQHTETEPEVLTPPVPRSEVIPQSSDGPVKANADSMSDPPAKLEHWLRQYKKWAREYEKAHDEWVKAVEASNNYLKGKWTPEYINTLSDTEKQQVAAKVLELHEACLTASKKLDALSEERPSFK